MTTRLLVSSLFLAVAPLSVACSSSGTTNNTTSDAGAVDSAALDGSTASDAASDSANDAPSDAATDASADSSSTDSTGADAPTTDAGALDSGDASGLAATCTAQGGSVATQLCCGATPDFPNTCGVGACSCAPSSSHEVQVCHCPTSHCWNGSSCVVGP